MSDRRAIFLDRDGTIIVDKGYLTHPDEIKFERRAIAGIRALANFQMPLVVISNQSGIGRGMTNREQVAAVNNRLHRLLFDQGVFVAGWYVCPHAPDEGCQCRKPAPGLIFEAVATMDVDPIGSVMIGDKDTDLMLARSVGARGILVTTGEGLRHQAWARQHGFSVADDLLAASRVI